MSLLSRLFGLKALANQKLPEVQLSVKGFEASLILKEGVLLTGSKKDKPGEKVNLSEPTYYEISIRPTGENPEYPAREKPFIVPCTVTTPDYPCSGMNGNTMFIPAGGKYTKFELLEEFDDMRGPRMGPMRGTEFPPHHRVTLKADYKDENGRRGQWSAGFVARKSEMESRAWKDAASSPYLGMCM